MALSLRCSAVLIAWLGAVFFAGHEPVGRALAQTSAVPAECTAAVHEEGIRVYKEVTDQWADKLKEKDTEIEMIREQCAGECSGCNEEESALLQRRFDAQVSELRDFEVQLKSANKARIEAVEDRKKIELKLAELEKKLQDGPDGGATEDLKAELEAALTDVKRAIGERDRERRRSAQLEQRLIALEIQAEQQRKKLEADLRVAQERLAAQGERATPGGSATSSAGAAPAPALSVRGAFRCPVLAGIAFAIATPGDAEMSDSAKRYVARATPPDPSALAEAVCVMTAPATVDQFTEYYASLTPGQQETVGRHWSYENPHTALRASPQSWVRRLDHATASSFAEWLGRRLNLTARLPEFNEWAVAAAQAEGRAAAELRAGGRSWTSTPCAADDEKFLAAGMRGTAGQYGAQPDSCLNKALADGLTGVRIAVPAEPLR